MRYCVIGKKALCILALCIIAIGSFGAIGIHRAVVSVSSGGKKSLPIYSVELPEQRKEVSFGINCAWGNEDIPQILDTLDHYQIKATFFVVGDWCKAYPDSVKEIFDRGHEIGNHSDTHPDMPALSKDQIISEIENCSEKIMQLTGEKPDLFRPPSGAYNNMVVDTARELGYQVIQWDCDSLDWKGLTAEEMQTRIFKKLRSGSILLFHNDTKYTARALPQMIERIQQQGYQIVPVGQMIYRENAFIDPTGRQFQKSSDSSTESFRNNE